MKRLRIRFSLFSLLALVAACALLFSWIAAQRVQYCHQHGVLRDVLSRTPEGSFCIVETEPATPSWLGVFVPQDKFYRVSTLSFVYVCEQDIAAATQLRFVGDLNFFMTEVTDQDLIPFGESKMQVNTLGLAYTQVTDKGVECFAGVHGLREIDLRCCGGVTGMCLKVLKIANIEDLDVGGSGFQGQNLRWVQHRQSLSRLFLRECTVSNDDIRYISGLDQLRELDLSDTSLDDHGMPALASLCGLKRLDLGGTKITDAGLVHLKNLQELEALNVSGTAIGDAGLKELRYLTSLQYLRLVDTTVTEIAMSDEFPQMKALKIVWVDTKTVTPDGANHLRIKGPSLRVIRTQERDGWP